MGLFDRFLKHKDPGILELCTPVPGYTKLLPDDTIGKGIAITPGEGRIYAPQDGVVDLMFATSHALSITTTDGIELFIHIGIDTAKLMGEGFRAIRQTDEAVKKGDVLVEFDLDFLKENGIDPTVSMYIMNDEALGMINTLTAREVALGDSVIETRKM